MPNKKVIGFYDFHITADKAKDLFLYNDFKPEQVSIYPIKKGEKFDTPATGLEQNEPVTNPIPAPKHLAAAKEKHTVARFLRHIFHIEKKALAPGEPFESDRDGFILSISSVTPEKVELARQMLDGHGAKYIHDFDD